jgi:hypothetical protein
MRSAVERIIAKITRAIRFRIRVIGLAQPFLRQRGRFPVFPICELYLFQSKTGNRPYCPARQGTVPVVLQAFAQVLFELGCQFLWPIARGFELP